MGTAWHAVATYSTADSVNASIEIVGFDFTDTTRHRIWCLNATLDTFGQWEASRRSVCLTLKVAYVAATIGSRSLTATVCASLINATRCDTINPTLY